MRFPAAFFAVAVVLAISAACFAGEIDSPYYTSWAACKPGTSVTFRCTSKSANGEQVTQTKCTLIDMSPTGCEIAVETFEDSDGQRKRELSSHVQTLAREPDNSKDGANFRSEMERAAAESVTVAAGTFKAKVFEHIVPYNTGQTKKTKIWFSADVPGGNVKTEVSEGRLDDLKITLKTELIAVDKK